MSRRCCARPARSLERSWSPWLAPNTTTAKAPTARGKEASASTWGTRHAAREVLIAFPELQEEPDGYTSSSGALRFKINEPLPKSLVGKLIAERLRQASPASPARDDAGTTPSRERSG